jgi:hypothetical protein
VIGRRFGALSSEPPNWIVIEPSGLAFALRLLMVYAFSGFGSKKPLAL